MESQATDLLLAILSILAFSVAVGLLAMRFGKHLGRLVLPAVVVLTFSAMLLQIFWAGHGFWARWIPASAVIVWSSLGGPLLAAAAGLVVHVPRISVPARPAMVGLLTIAAVAVPVWAPLRPQFRPIRQWDAPRWSQGVCLQANEVTCGPAAAATLLAQHGVSATERSLYRTCLTSGAGTPPLGLYRGLKRSASEADHRVEIASGTLEEVLSKASFPLIALVEVESIDPTRPISRALGRTRTLEGHAVVVFGRNPDGTFDIGDPAVGRQQWNAKQMQQAWAGDAFWLEHRRGACSAEGQSQELTAELRTRPAGNPRL